MTMYKIEPAFGSIKVEGDKVITTPGKFATFYEAMHDLVNHWESENWELGTFKYFMYQLLAEWY